MEWTDPRTWTIGESVTKAIMDTHIRDNLNWLHNYAGGSNPMPLPIASAQAPLSGLTAAALEVSQSGSATIKPQFYKLLFDGAADEGRMWNFVVPSNYVNNPKVIVQFHLATSDTAARTVIFNAQVAAISNADTGMNAKEYDTTNAGSTAINGGTYINEQQTITLSNADSMAAGDLVSLVLWRDADTDTCIRNAIVTYVGFSCNV